MKITKKLTPTCVKENIERKNAKIFQNEEGQQFEQQPVEKPNLETNEPSQNNQTNEEVALNPSLARDLKRLVFGRNGELSLLLSYVYQNSVLRQLNSSLKAEIERILPIQFETYITLSKWVNLLGAKPTLTDGRGNVWTGRNVNYSINPQIFIERTIKTLQNQIEEYERLLLKNDSLEFNLVLSNVILQKKKQVQTFLNFLT